VSSEQEVFGKTIDEVVNSLEVRRPGAALVYGDWSPHR
jgi:hypothetical protein